MTFAFFSFLRFVYRTQSPLIIFWWFSFAPQISTVFLKFRVSGPCFFHTSNEILTYIFNITYIIMLFECFGSKKFMTWRCPKRPVWPPSKTDTILTQLLIQIWHFWSNPTELHFEHFFCWLLKANYYDFYNVFQWNLMNKDHLIIFLVAWVQPYQTSKRLLPCSLLLYQEVCSLLNNE